MPRRPCVELLLASFLILFYELAAIRWFASTVVFLTFFTNVVLIASFLGMSLGLLTAHRSQNLMRTTLPLAALAFALAIAVYALYWQWAGSVTIALSGAQDSPQLVYFGTEYRPADPTRWVVPMWAVASLFFVLVALSFVGPGQVMGRAFQAIPNRVAAYTIDIAGSLGGIAAFAAMSYFQLPPMAWFLPIMLAMLYFAGWRSPVQLASALIAYALVSVGAYGLTAQGPVNYWSPYYRVSYDPDTRSISTNGIGHQSMLAIGSQGPAYLLPYLLNADSGGAAFNDVMIVGAGSGNDVAAALRAGARRVDAVEIDPRIQSLGRSFHPDRPYADARVAVHLDDGRSFVRTARRKYDLAVYALVDSLVLHTGYSSLRLENFLFTREALEDVRLALKPGGIFVMYNFYRQGWVIARLAKLAQDVFGVPPLVISLPYQERIAPGDSEARHFTFILAAADPSRLQGIRERFARGESYWINEDPAKQPSVNGFGATPPPGKGWHRMAPARVDLPDIDLLPSDDWPQLYLRAREIPWAPIGQGMLAMAVLSLAVLFAFAPLRRLRPNGQMFFLGAGFMLIETKAVVHMALLFGSTWMVNSIVFFAILVMIVVANLFVLAMRPRRLAPYYAALIAALLLNAVIPMSAFLSLGPVARTLGSCAVVFLPVFFAGVVFAATFSRSRQPDVDLGSNVAGIILGGLSEQLSLVLGFNKLVLLAAAYYVASSLLAPRAIQPRS